MRVLVACEYTGTVRDAFLALGHDATSCDLRPTAVPGPHIRGDARAALELGGWDLLIAHPPCTHLAYSGARWWADKAAQRRMFSEATLQEEAIEFARAFIEAPVPRVCVENPMSILSKVVRKPEQVIQPWQFGDSYQKTTCLWLKGLPPLVPTKVVDRGEIVIHGGRRIARWISNRERARDATFPGIAAAMAAQWGGVPGAGLTTT